MTKEIDWNYYEKICKIIQLQSVLNTKSRLMLRLKLKSLWIF